MMESFPYRVNIPNCKSLTKLLSFLKTVTTIGSLLQILRVSISSCPTRNTGRYFDNRFSMHIQFVCHCVCVYCVRACKINVECVSQHVCVGCFCVCHVCMCMCVWHACFVQVNTLQYTDMCVCMCTCYSSNLVIEIVYV